MAKKRKKRSFSWQGALAGLGQSMVASGQQAQRAAQQQAMQQQAFNQQLELDRIRAAREAERNRVLDARYQTEFGYKQKQDKLGYELEQKKLGLDEKDILADNQRLADELKFKQAEAQREQDQLNAMRTHLQTFASGQLQPPPPGGMAPARTPEGTAVPPPVPMPVGLENGFLGAGAPPPMLAKPDAPPPTPVPLPATSQGGDTGKWMDFDAEINRLANMPIATAEQAAMIQDDIIRLKAAKAEQERQKVLWGREKTKHMIGLATDLNRLTNEVRGGGTGTKPKADLLVDEYNELNKVLSDPDNEEVYPEQWASAKQRVSELRPLLQQAGYVLPPEPTLAAPPATATPVPQLMAGQSATSGPAPVQSPELQRIIQQKLQQGESPEIIERAIQIMQGQ